MSSYGPISTFSPRVEWEVFKTKISGKYDGAKAKATEYGQKTKDASGRAVVNVKAGLTSDKAKKAYKYTGIVLAMLAVLVAAGLVVGHYGAFEPAGNWLQAKVSIANGWISGTASQANAWIQQVALPKIHGFFTNPSMAPWAYGLIYAGAAGVVASAATVGVMKGIDKYRGITKYKKLKTETNAEFANRVQLDQMKVRYKKLPKPALLGPNSKKALKYTAIALLSLAVLAAGGLVFGQFVGFNHAGTWLNTKTAIANTWIHNTAITAGRAIKLGATHNLGWPAWANGLFYGSVGILGGAAIGALAIKGCKAAQSKYRAHKLDKLERLFPIESEEEKDSEFDNSESDSGYKSGSDSPYGEL